MTEESAYFTHLLAQKAAEKKQEPVFDGQGRHVGYKTQDPPTPKIDSADVLHEAFRRTAETRQKQIGILLDEAAGLAVKAGQLHGWLRSGNFETRTAATRELVEVEKALQRKREQISAEMMMVGPDPESAAFRKTVGSMLSDISATAKGE